MARFKSIRSEMHQHLYGTVRADGSYYGQDFRVRKGGTGYYTVSFNSPFYGDPGVSCTLYTEGQDPSYGAIGATSVKVINHDFSSFTYCTLRGDEPYDSGVIFIVFGRS